MREELVREELRTFPLNINDDFSPLELLVMSDKPMSRSANVYPVSHTCRIRSKNSGCALLRGRSEPLRESPLP